MSNSVAKAMEITLGNKAQETAKFVETFDKFFDCLNVSSLSAGKLSKNSFKSPYAYRSGKDFRFRVSATIAYLK